MVPGLMTQVRLPPEPDSNCVTTIVDSQHGDKAIIMKKQQQGSESSLTSFTNPNVNKQQKQQPDQQQQQKQQQHHHHHNKKVDAIILVYDLDRVETFYRLENHWLPLIERYYDGEVSSLQNCCVGIQIILFCDIRMCTNLLRNFYTHISLTHTHTQTTFFFFRFQSLSRATSGI
jgi:hypothetical protein